MSIKALYIHIPFCKKICSYCDFCKIYYNPNIIKNYLSHLKQELLTVYQKDTLSSIYIGGGTPSCLTIAELELLFNIIDETKKSSDCEITIECNFDSTTKEKLDLFKKRGVNRLSFGLESTIEKNLEFLNRELDKKQVIEVIEYANEIGLNNINIDLIYALPNQTIKDLEKDLDFITNLNIKHISTYSLIIEENTLLSLNKVKNISEEKDYSMYEYICNYLKDKNFIHYEISNFSKQGFESYHNRVYWKNTEYYGIGLGAASYVDNKRITNTRSITKYLKGCYKLNEEKLSPLDIMDYEIMLNLRLAEGINKKNFFNKFKSNVIDNYDYKKLVAEKLLEETDKNIYINEKDWYVSNTIILKLLDNKIN